VEHGPETERFLATVEASIGAALGEGRRADDPSGILDHAARRLCMSGGKRFRAWLVHALGQAAGASDEALARIATSAELIHAASLLHDDVVDEGLVRRGVPTANAAYGNLVAVLAGDMLLATAIQGLQPLGASVICGAVDAVASMARAMIEEADARGVDLTEAQWRRIAAGKTGALLGWVGLAVGKAGGDVALADRLAAAGEHLGVAFQAADDLRDILATDPGKPALADLRTGTPSLPIILAAGLDPAVAGDIAALRRMAAPDPEVVEAVARGVRESGAMGAARAVIEREVALAAETLGPLAASGGDRQVLRWAERLVREFTVGGEA